MAWASVSKGVEIVEDIIVIEESSVTLFTYTGTQVCLPCFHTNQLIAPDSVGESESVVEEDSVWYD